MGQKGKIIDYKGLKTYMVFDGNELAELEGTPLIPPLLRKNPPNSITSVTSGKYGDLRRLMVPSIFPLKASIMKFYSKYCGCKRDPSRKKVIYSIRAYWKGIGPKKSLSHCLCLNQSLNFRKNIVGNLQEWWLTIGESEKISSGKKDKWGKAPYWLSLRCSFLVNVPTTSKLYWKKDDIVFVVKWYWVRRRW